MHLPLQRVVAVVGVALLQLAGTPALVASATPTAAPASTIRRAANGARCTKVGTNGNDVIRGTSKADVICGLGGNDRIIGGSGNDVIDGGSGNDTIAADSGNDTVFGGSGADRVTGGTGDDRVLGGADADTIAGSGGNDTLVGGTGNDSLRGETGNDDLAGNGGSDSLDGGSGTNWCDIESTDARTACVVDQTPAAPVDLRLSTKSVDVTAAEQQIEYAVHVTDDTGVRLVQVGAQFDDGHGYARGGLAILERGTVRDGWWTGTLTVPRYLAAGTMSVNAFVTDRVGRDSNDSWGNSFTVVSRNPDIAPPVVRSFTLDRSTVDVRTQARTVSATFRITDDVAGVDESGLFLCPSHLFADGFRQSDGCSAPRRLSGTSRDGLYRASFTVPAKAASGYWNFSVWAEDSSSMHGITYYVGPDAYEQGVLDGLRFDEKPLPGGGGRFTVIGTGDTTAPTLTSLSVTPSDVTTTTQGATVIVEVTAADTEGITGIGINSFAYIGGQPVHLVGGAEATLVSGDEHNGVWRTTIEVPQGMPPGSYPLSVQVEDRTHRLTYAAPSYPWAALNAVTILQPAQLTSGTAVVTVH